MFAFPSLSLASSVLLLAAAFAAAGCKSRGFNAGAPNASAKSDSAGSGEVLSTFLCESRGSPDWSSEDLGGYERAVRYDIGRVQITLLKSDNPAKPRIRIEKMGSFSQWADASVGKGSDPESVKKWEWNVGEGTVESVDLQTFQAGWAYFLRWTQPNASDQTFQMTFQVGRNVNAKHFKQVLPTLDLEGGLSRAGNGIRAVPFYCAAYKDSGTQAAFNDVITRGGGTTSAALDPSQYDESADSSRGCIYAGWVSRKETTCDENSAREGLPCKGTTTIQGSGGSTNLRQAEGLDSTLIRAIPNNTQVEVKKASDNGSRLAVRWPQTGDECPDLQRRLK